VLACTDRTVQFLLSEIDHDDDTVPFLRLLALRTGMVVLPVGRTTLEDLNRAVVAGMQALKQGHLVALSADGVAPSRATYPDFVQILLGLTAVGRVPIIPVYCGRMAPVLEVNGQVEARQPRRIQVVIGHPMPERASPEDIRRAIDQLGNWLHEETQKGPDRVLTTQMIPRSVNDDHGRDQGDSATA
jgi:hypothetical protein